jgi:hypothetical protein
VPTASNGTTAIAYAHAPESVVMERPQRRARRAASSPSRARGRAQAAAAKLSVRTSRSAHASRFAQHAAAAAG